MAAPGNGVSAGQDRTSLTYGANGAPIGSPPPSPFAGRKGPDLATQAATVVENLKKKNADLREDNEALKAEIESLKATQLTVAPPTESHLKFAEINKIMLGILGNGFPTPSEEVLEKSFILKRFIGPVLDLTKDIKSSTSNFETQVKNFNQFNHDFENENFLQTLIALNTQYKEKLNPELALFRDNYLTNFNKVLSALSDCSKELKKSLTLLHSKDPRLAATGFITAHLRSTTEKQPFKAIGADDFGNSFVARDTTIVLPSNWKFTNIAAFINKPST